MESLRSNTILINVFDHKLNKFIAKNITMHEAATMVDTTYKNVCFAKKRQSLIKGRYRIIFSCYAPVIIKTEEEFKTYSEQLEKRWNEAVKPFRILYKRKNGRR